MARQNSGVGRLLTSMRKMIREVNDQEVCRRLEILINSEKEDLPGHLVKKIFDSPDDVEAKQIPEPFTQYVMHYFFMIRRESRHQEKQDEIRLEKKEKRLSKKSAGSVSGNRGAGASSGKKRGPIRKKA